MRRSLTFALAAACLGLASLAAAQTYPAKPGRDDFFSDEAGLLSPQAKAQVDQIAWALWKQDQVPLYVVTINSLADHQAAGLPIEGYAYDLFNAWGIGSQRRNYGMLLLVSKGDRKARIELGSGWGHDYNVQAQQVMEQLIIPEFRQGDFSAGIVAGVKGMDALARGLQLPQPAIPWWVYVFWVAFAVLVFFVARSLFKSGRSGWGWAFLAAIAALLFFLFRMAASSGAGMGGGSSGGGGATGSW